ncbi:hypothetical protein F5887DRAFT_212588 [Amanita rubescens]|nr:hypothetical protein F5887DRAFT_212588 [Amanita rubescens]
MSRHAQLYRGILNELKRSAITPGRKNQDVQRQMRSIVELARKSESVQDLESAVLFLRSQREHKVLLHRYNPLSDYTSEERIKATANRVGLNMPKALGST